MNQLTTPPSRDGERAACALQKLWSLRNSEIIQSSFLIPRTSSERLSSSSLTTILYLAYGSNLSAETFKGARGIKPISAINVHVPSLELIFDLVGIPYIEPCFANTTWRKQDSQSPIPSRYHKGQWGKGLIGVVYEVTPEDYRTIIATEGGGASYQDVVVPCYAIPEGSKTVNTTPSGVPFKAHTLLQPEEDDSKRARATAGRVHRPDPEYAQASARYLKLITDGAEEHSLPEEYLHYLHNLQPYTITTKRQRAGQALIIAFWSPLLLFLFGLSRSLADEEGKIPDWLATVMAFVFGLLWQSYDMFYKPAFGDGERTMEKEDEELSGRHRWCEKRSGESAIVI